MKHLKMLALLVMAAASLMACAGSASAATFTSPTGTEYTGAFSMSLEGSLLKKPGFAETTCTTGTIAGEITTNNEEHATGRITAVSFGSQSTPCTSSQGTPIFSTLSSTGTITIKKGTHTVSGTGVEITEAVIGTSCVYGFGTGTVLGTADNTVVSGVDKVTLTMNGTDGLGAQMPKVSGGFLCANPARWKGNYIVTTPASSFVD